MLWGESLDRLIDESTAEGETMCYLRFKSVAKNNPTLYGSFVSPPALFTHTLLFHSLFFSPLIVVTLMSLRIYTRDAVQPFPVVDRACRRVRWRRLFLRSLPPSVLFHRHHRENTTFHRMFLP